MEYERRRISKGVLNLTPLIDIVFLLLVFFMLTAHFIEEEQIDIQLPRASSADPIEKDRYVTVLLSPTGEVFVNSRVVEIELLPEVLRGELHAPDKKFVRLKGDHRAQFGKAVQIIDAARMAGADALDIQTEQP